MAPTCAKNDLDDRRQSLGKKVCISRKKQFYFNRNLKHSLFKIEKRMCLFLDEFKGRYAFNVCDVLFLDFKTS